MTSTAYTDPFAAAEKAPALSFKDRPVGFGYLGCKVTGTPNTVQSIDFESGERATWPDGNPKMSVVINVEYQGEPRSLWAAKPSALYAACGEAQRVSGLMIGPGVLLDVVYTGDVPNAKNPRLNPAKQYRISLRQASDAFADTGPAVGRDEPPF